MSDSHWYSYPQNWIDKYGPRNLVHSFATETDEPTAGAGRIFDRRLKLEVNLYKRIDQLTLSDIVFLRWYNGRLLLNQFMLLLHSTGIRGSNGQDDLHLRGGVFPWISNCGLRGSW